MGDEQNIGADGAPAAEPQNTAHEHMIPKSRFDEVNNKYKDLATQLEQLKAQQEQREEQRMQEQQQYKELAEKYKQELEGLKPVAGQVKDWQQSLAETAQAQIERLPEDMRELVPEYDDPRKTLDWLNKNAARLMRSPMPDMDAGARGDVRSSKVKLTPDQQEAARAAGISEEKYIARLIALEGER